MSNRVALLVLGVLGWGCAPPPVMPAADERLAALPADASLVGRFDAPSLLAAPEAAELLAGFGLPADALAALVGADGLSVDSLVVGCADDGCVVLLDGDFHAGDTAIDALLAHPPRGLDLVRVAGVRGVDGVTEAGDDLVLRILSPDKAVVGDREAVRGVWERGGAGGLDATAVAALAPATESWLLVRDPARLEATLVARADAREPGGGAVWRARGASLRARFPEVAGVESVAVGLALGGSPAVAARVVCADEAAALAAEARARVGSLGRAGQVRREGRVVDLVGAVDLAAWGAP